MIIQLSMFDGKVCCSCQKWQPISAFQKNKSTADGLQKQCKECRRAGYNKVKDVLLDKKKKQYWNNPEKARIAKRLDHQKHKVERNKKRLAYRIVNLTSENERTRKWFKSNPDRVRQISKANQSRRRARKRNQGGKHTVNQWIALLEWFGSACLVCGATERIEADHVTAISRGGSDDIANLQPLCAACNKSKSTKRIDYRDPDRLRLFLEHIQC